MAVHPVATGPAALAEPTVPVPARWVWLYSLAMFAFFAVNWGAASILTPELASRVGGDNKVAVLGAIMGIGGVLGAIGAPVVGALSDRTTSRWGRRHPWILAATLGTAVLLATLSVQTGLIAALLLAPLAAALPQCALTALSATVPDDVPVGQRATVSAFDRRARDALAVYGDWLDLHGRAIYGCTASEFTPPADCRYTQRGDRLYLHVFAWPSGVLPLDGLAGRVAYAQLLADASEIRLVDSGRALELPVHKPGVVVPVIELFLEES